MSRRDWDPDPLNPRQKVIRFVGGPLDGETRPDFGWSEEAASELEREAVYTRVRHLDPSQDYFQFVEWRPLDRDEEFPPRRCP